MVHEFFDRNSKYEIELFKRSLFCLRQEEKYEYCCNDIKAGKEAERACVIDSVADSVKLR